MRGSGIDAHDMRVRVCDTVSFVRVDDMCAVWGPIENDNYGFTFRAAQTRNTLMCLSLCSSQNLTKRFAAANPQHYYSVVKRSVES